MAAPQCSNSANACSALHGCACLPRRPHPAGPRLLQGLIHLTDRQGVCKPPLRGPVDEQLDDPFVLSYRRNLTVIASGGEEEEAEGQPSGQPAQLAVVESASGRQVAAFHPMQRVWVQLSADGSRVHGPSLRMRLLADSHPAAVEAARRGEACDTCSSSAVGAAGAARTARRLSGLIKAAVPPGFEGRNSGAADQFVSGPAGSAHPAAAPGPPAHQSQGPASAAMPTASGTGGGAGGTLAAKGTPVEPASLAAQLQAALQLAGGAPEDRNALAWQATLPAIDQPQAVSNRKAGVGSIVSCDADSAEQHGQKAWALARALRRLQARSARLQLRAKAAPPGRPRTERRLQAAAVARQELAILQQQLMPGRFSQQRGPS